MSELTIDAIEECINFSSLKNKKNDKSDSASEELEALCDEVIRLENNRDKWRNMCKELTRELNKAEHWCVGKERCSTCFTRQQLTLLVKETKKGDKDD